MVIKVAVLLILLFGGPGGDPPIVGRPPDFSGAVGGPFVVQWVVNPNTVTAEEPATLTLQIIGPGNLAEMPRPALAKHDAFKRFAIDSLDDRFTPGDPPRREFRYRVRPRSADVKEVPRLKFVYFNPRIVPASRGYQTTYADSIPLTVKPRPTVAPTGPADVPAWMLEMPTTDELFGLSHQPWQDWMDWLLARVGVDIEVGPSPNIWLLGMIALLVPPSACGAWFLIWRRYHPDAIQLAAGRRSRAGVTALNALHRSGNDGAEIVATALINYLRDRAGLPANAATPAEVEATLLSLGCPPHLVTATIALLHRCDAARFGPGSRADGALNADTEKTILQWEAATWSGPAC
jgi:hypothetical protein